MQVTSLKKFQLVNIEDLKKISNHYSTKTTVIIVPGKIHWWMIKSVDECFKRNRIFAVSIHPPPPPPPPRCWCITKWIIVACGKTNRHHLNHLVKWCRLTWPVLKKSNTGTPWYDILRGTRYHLHGILIKNAKP